MNGPAAGWKGSTQVLKAAPRDPHGHNVSTRMVMTRDRSALSTVTPNVTLAVAPRPGQGWMPTTLTRVLRILGRAGLVSATRGVGGGYQFCGNPKRTTLLDIIELFETVGEPKTGAASANGLTPEDRMLGEVLGEIDDIVHATLDSITIATMLRLVEDRRHERRAPPPQSRARRGAGPR